MLSWDTAEALPRYCGNADEIDRATNNPYREAYLGKFVLMREGHEIYFSNISEASRQYLSSANQAICWSGCLVNQ